MPLVDAGQTGEAVGDVFVEQGVSECMVLHDEVRLHARLEGSHGEAHVQGTAVRVILASAFAEGGGRLQLALEARDGGGCSWMANTTVPLRVSPSRAPQRRHRGMRARRALEEMVPLDADALTGPLRLAQDAGGAGYVMEMHDTQGGGWRHLFAVPYTRTDPEFSSAVAAGVSSAGIAHAVFTAGGVRYLGRADPHRVELLLRIGSVEVTAAALDADGTFVLLGADGAWAVDNAADLGGFSSARDQGLPTLETVGARAIKPPADSGILTSVVAVTMKLPATETDHDALGCSVACPPSQDVNLATAAELESFSTIDAGAAVQIIARRPHSSLWGCANAVAAVLGDPIGDWVEHIVDGAGSAPEPLCYCNPAGRLCSDQDNANVASAEELAALEGLSLHTADLIVSGRSGLRTATPGSPLC